MREDELHAPRLGENTREVLRELGYAETELDLLAEKGAIAEPNARAGAVA